MYSPSLGNRTSKWFFDFLDNLDLTPNSEIDDTLCTDILDGRAFPLKFSSQDEQIWKRVSEYLTENYIKNDKNFELFR